MLAGKFVLENANGEVVRTFAVEGQELFVIYRQDYHRVEVVSSLDDLNSHEIPYQLIKKIKNNSERARSFKLENGAHFRFVHEVTSTAALVRVSEDSTEEEKVIYKYMAFGQLGLMFLILIVGLLIEPLFHKEEKENIVVVTQQLPMPARAKAPTVKVSEKKVKQPTKVAKKVHKSPVKQEKVVRAKSKVKSYKKANAPVRTNVKVENVGALGVLGGTKTGSKTSSGFNMKALNDSRGTSMNGAGRGGSGGIERAVPGKGLMASAAGSGEKIRGGGGYSTRGSAGGGRPGYGALNLGGTAAAYFEPLQEEALIEGGLDKDQIAAVINKHIGEVIYCYEKGLQVQPKLNGRVGVNFNINGSGKVSSASVGASSLKNAAVEGCIINRLKGWKFPKPVGGVNVKVQYPFVLKRVNRG